MKVAVVARKLNRAVQALSSTLSNLAKPINRAWDFDQHRREAPKAAAKSLMRYGTTVAIPHWTIDLTLRKHSI